MLYLGTRQALDWNREQNFLEIQIFLNAGAMMDAQLFRINKMSCFTSMPIDDEILNEFYK